MLTKPMLQALWPKAKPEKIEAILKVAPDVFKKYEINTPLRVAHLMAQISHENGGGTIVRENMNYSAQRLLQIFGVGKDSAAITPQEAAILAHKPKEIAERVYGLGCPKKAKGLGNTQAGDGWRFRGNGDLQLTGRGSHASIGKMIGKDLETNPEQLESPAISFWCAVAEFHESKCLPWADKDDVLSVSRCVNVGTPNTRATPNGMGERRAWLANWKTALSRETAQVEEASHEQIEEALEADKEPRGSEPSSPPMSKSTIGTGSVVAGGAAGAGLLSTIMDEISKLPSTIFDLVMKMVEKPTFWLFLVCGSAGGYVYYRRYVMKRDEGV